MVRIERSHHLLLQDGARIVVDPHAALFEDHFPLGLHVLLGQAQIRHAVRFHLHHEGKTVRGDALEIGGDVVIGEGIVLAALAAMSLENWPGGIISVPLNIRCSRKWAMPEEPCGSSAEPARYQIICVTTGAR